MKKFATLALVALLSAGSSFADDARVATLANQLVDQVNVAIDAATPPEDGSIRPPRIRNWRLRSNLKDIRKVATKLRDRAAKGKGHSLVSKLKVKQIKANMRTCNFLAQNHAARGLDAFAPAWQSARDIIGQIVGEMCCGEDSQAGDGGGNKEMAEEASLE
jgi:hypothetical protein